MLGTGHRVTVQRHRSSRRSAPLLCERQAHQRHKPGNENSAPTVLSSLAAPPRRGCLRETLVRREHRRRVLRSAPIAWGGPRAVGEGSRHQGPWSPSCLLLSAGGVSGVAGNQRKSPPQTPGRPPAKDRKGDRRDACLENGIPRMTGPRRAEPGVPTRCPPAWLFELRAKSYTHQGNMTASRGWWSVSRGAPPPTGRAQRTGRGESGVFPARGPGSSKLVSQESK